LAWADAAANATIAASAKQKKTARFIEIMRTAPRNFFGSSGTRQSQPR
jgi:hypothetical protein